MYLERYRQWAAQREDGTKPATYKPYNRYQMLFRFSQMAYPAVYGSLKTRAIGMEEGNVWKEEKTTDSAYAL